MTPIVRKLTLGEFPRYYDLVVSEDDVAILQYCCTVPAGTPKDWPKALDVDTAAGLLDEVERVNFTGLALWASWRPGRLKRLLDAALAVAAKPSSASGSASGAASAPVPPSVGPTSTP